MIVKQTITISDKSCFGGWLELEPYHTLVWSTVDWYNWWWFGLEPNHMLVDLLLIGTIDDGAWLGLEPYHTMVDLTSGIILSLSI